MKIKHLSNDNFKGIREFNKVGLKAILLELELGLDYDTIDPADLFDTRLLIKCLIDRTSYLDYFSYFRLEENVRYSKPYGMKWEDFKEYSRNYFEYVSLETFH